MSGTPRTLCRDITWQAWLKSYYSCACFSEKELREETCYVGTRPATSPLPCHVQGVEKRLCFHFGFVALVQRGSGKPQQG